VSKIFPRSRGLSRSAKLSRLKISGDADEMNGACAEAATCETRSSS
jgi:hypothetical protein